MINFFGSIRKKNRDEFGKFDKKSNQKKSLCFTEVFVAYDLPDPSCWKTTKFLIVGTFTKWNVQIENCATITCTFADNCNHFFFFQMTLSISAEVGSSLSQKSCQKPICISQWTWVSHTISIINDCCNNCTLSKGQSISIMYHAGRFIAQSADSQTTTLLLN